MPGFLGHGLSRKPQVRLTKETQAQEYWETQSKKRQGFDQGTGRRVCSIFSHSDTGDVTELCSQPNYQICPTTATRYKESMNSHMTFGASKAETNLNPHICA